VRNPKLIWLDKNENLDPTLANLTAGLLKAMDPLVIYTYPEFDELYRKLASYLDIAVADLVVTAGSDFAIRSVFDAFISPGDVVVYTCPTYAMYPVYSDLSGCKAFQLTYSPGPNGPELSVEHVVKTISSVRPKLVCVANPDSPTGNVFDPEALVQIIQAAGRSGSLILVDEAYYPFYEHSILPKLEEYSHLIVARSFSKAWGLAGLRIGCAAACSELTGHLHRVRPKYEVNGLAVAMLEQMLDCDHEMVASVQRLNAGRNAFLSAMQDLGFRTLRPTANFCHVSFDHDAELVHKSLESVVAYRRDFKEPCLAGFSRFSSAPLELLQPVIHRIQSVVTNGRQQ